MDDDVPVWRGDLHVLASEHRRKAKAASGSSPLSDGRLKPAPPAGKNSIRKIGVWRTQHPMN